MTTFANVMKLSPAMAARRAGTNDAEPSDLELLMQVQGKSRRALEMLYERYSSKALGLAFKILRDRDLAEDVVIEAFWRVWRRADQFQMGRGSFAAWFYGIVRHLAIDEFRRRDARPEPSEDQELESAFAGDATSAHEMTDWIMQRLNADTVQSAVDALPAPQREVIRLAYFEGLTRQEISKRLGEPLGTVHTRARLGLDKLRMMLAPSQMGM